MLPYFSYICETGSTRRDPEAGKCLKGHFCTKGALAAIPCSQGTYNSQQGNVQSSDQSCCHMTDFSVVSTLLCFSIKIQILRTELHAIIL